MEVGEVKVPESKDFQTFREAADNDSSWTLSLKNNKKQLFIYSRQTPGTKIQQIKIKALFPGISAALLYDTLQDTAYTHSWDAYCVRTEDICYIDPMNIISYYAMKLQSPLRNRDFVLQRSWLYNGQDYAIFNHSVNHKDYPPQKGFIRGISELTGFLIKPMKGKDNEANCHLTYISQSDPKGSIPSWFVNSVGKTFAPRQIKVLQKACIKYDKWKNKQKNPKFKPWNDPEQLMTSLARINWPDVQAENQPKVSEELELDDEFEDEKEIEKVLKGVNLNGDSSSNSNSACNSDDDDEIEDLATEVNGNGGDAK
ncbi:START domain-containing protein 10-like [Symsagittifera roscoffensis]|uniref:START domain-containing protein 10-like n=1 Tax=Symsagittifera roscoffensis TaxID=84072 RepID=UPI00307BC411